MPIQLDPAHLAYIEENPTKRATALAIELGLMGGPSLSSVRRHRVVRDASPVYMAGRVRPTIAWATWYRKLHAEAPDMPVEQLTGLAELLRANADDDGEGAAEVRRQIEGWIAYRPWTEAGKGRYLADVKAGLIPQLRSFPDLQAFTEERDGIVLWDKLTKKGLYKWKRDVGFVQSARRKRARAAKLKKKPSGITPFLPFSSPVTGL